VSDLTPGQNSKFVKHFTSKTNIVCPMCGQKSWSTGPILHGQPWAEGTLVLGGPSVPLATIVCDNCHFIAYFAAVPIGLLEKDQDASVAPVMPPEGWKG